MGMQGHLPRLLHKFSRAKVCPLSVTVSAQSPGNILDCRLGTAEKLGHFPGVLRTRATRMTPPTFRRTPAEPTPTGTTQGCTATRGTWDIEPGEVRPEHQQQRLVQQNPRNIRVDLSSRFTRHLGHNTINTSHNGPVNRMPQGPLVCRRNNAGNLALGSFLGRNFPLGSRRSNVWPPSELRAKKIGSSGTDKRRQGVVGVDGPERGLAHSRLQPEFNLEPCSWEVRQTGLRRGPTAIGQLSENRPHLLRGRLFPWSLLQKIKAQAAC